MNQATLTILGIATLIALGVAIYVLVFWQPPPVEAIDWSVVEEVLNTPADAAHADWVIQQGQRGEGGAI